MKEIFISYSSVDFPQADTVRSVLEKNGLSCWMAPRDIPGGSNYTKEIPIAIRNCKVFVLILSQRAQSSHWVLKELDSAVNCGKVILPFMLEDCALNDEFNFLLTGAQRYSAYQKKAEAMETLIGRIRGIIDIPATPKDAPAEEIPQPEPVKPAKPAAKKTTIDYFYEAKCPACGGEDLKERKGKVKYASFLEYLTLLWIPALAVVTGFLGTILAGFLLSFDVLFLFSELIAVVCIILGAILGSIISGNSVKRSRLRHGISSTCYRCNRCKKVFDHNKPLNN